MTDWDWYTLTRRVALISFILLTIWGVMQASGQLALDWKICFWPLLRAPLWYKVVYYLLGFWLIYPYIWLVRAK